MRKNPYPGKFILLEGIDGSGKTTQSKMLADRLTQEGYSAFLTREPTSDNMFGRLARFIYTCESLHEQAPDELRRCMAHADYHALCALADALQQKHLRRFEKMAHEIIAGNYRNLQTFLQLAMIFDRLYHHREMIIYRLEQGAHVVADRGFLSTLAYSAADDIVWEPLLEAHEEIMGDAFIVPDQIFLLDVSVDIGIRRTMAKQQGKKEYFDTHERLTKIRDRYIRLCSGPIIANNTAVATIHSNMSPEDIHEHIWPNVESLIMRGTK